MYRQRTGRQPLRLGPHTENANRSTEASYRTPDMAPERKKGPDIAPRTEPGIGIVGYVGVFLVVAALLAILFYRTTPQEN